MKLAWLTFFQISIKVLSLYFVLPNVHILCRIQTIMKAFIDPIKGLTFQYRFAKYAIFVYWQNNWSICILCQNNEKSAIYKKKINIQMKIEFYMHGIKEPIWYEESHFLVIIPLTVLSDIVYNFKNIAKI